MGHPFKILMSLVCRKAPSSVVEDSEVLESSQRSELSVDGEGMAPPGAAGSTSNRSKRSRKS